MASSTLDGLAAEPRRDSEAILNLSCYKFVPLDNLGEMRQILRDMCQRLRIKGTILLSREGINFFVAGPGDSIGELVGHLRTVPGLEDIQPKESLSDDQPFSRMLVRIKQEIIAFGVDGIDPARYTSKKLRAVQLKQWLDEGRQLTLLDVRNNYEVEVGTFHNALPINVDHFRDFPAAAALLSPETKDQPIVMFCTGGIRCEKAGPLMEHLGYREIYQLDGGILKYFEEVGGAHWHGECFVFDKRVALDPHLAETATTQCYACQHPLTPTDQSSTHFIPGVQCPYCFNLVAEREKRHRHLRQTALDQFATNLPGSRPYDNLRPLNVPQRFSGLPLLEFLDQLHPQVGRSTWAARVDAGRLLLGNQRVSADLVVREGMGLRHLLPDTVEPNVNARIKIVFDDANVVVVEKPAPLPVHACGRFNRNTLEWMLQQVYRPQRLKLVHRLDADTSGLMVIARHRRAATALHQLFQTDQVTKVYLARVVGHPATDHFVSTAPISDGPEAEGLRTVTENGLPSETHFSVRERLADGTSLLEVRPITGRTNQIRVHLWELGFPILGESTYLPNRQLARGSSKLPQDAPLCLHAWRLELLNPFLSKSSASDMPSVPTCEATYRWETGLPQWAKADLGNADVGEAEATAIDSPLTNSEARLAR
ncbi:MAG: pseudouridine synthase [Pirellulaceae bacterium]|nr:pseudouridine synthase [Pirellulaceae bacterium]